MDQRDEARNKTHWYESFNREEMTVEVRLYDDEDDYLVEFPVEYVVCSLCNGKGKHVNPSIDAHGILPEEFSEDPDFAEDYFGGVYDVSCYECKGLRVVPEIVGIKFLTEEQKKSLSLLEEKWEDEAMYAAECAAERRMGA